MFVANAQRGERGDKNRQRHKRFRKKEIQKERGVKKERKIGR
jgi:hypothetical protein